MFIRRTENAPKFFETLKLKKNLRRGTPLPNCLRHLRRLRSQPPGHQSLNTSLSCYVLHLQLTRLKDARVSRRNSHDICWRNLYKNTCTSRYSEDFLSCFRVQFLSLNMSLPPNGCFTDMTHWFSGSWFTAQMLWFLSFCRSCGWSSDTGCRFLIC